MSIKNIQQIQLGQVGNNISCWTIETDDTLETVSATGFLNEARSAYQFQFSPMDYAFVYTSDYGLMFMQLLISANGVDFSLSNPYESIVDGVNFTGTPVPNQMAAFSVAGGTIKSGANNITNPGNILAGLSGTGGFLASFPGTASKGSLRLSASDNTGNTVTTITNAEMGQATTVTIPDPEAATATFLLANSELVAGNLVVVDTNTNMLKDADFHFKGEIAGPFAGGATSYAFSANVNSDCIPVATILSSTNNVTVTKAVPTNGTLTIHFSADPGANTYVNWIAMTNTVV